MKLRAVLLACGLVLTLAPIEAHADAIEGPPACPPGTTGRSSHHGQWCAPAECTDSCDDGARCMQWRVCTRATMVPPWMRGPSDGVPTRVELVIATCEPSLACTGSEEPSPPTIGSLVDEPTACRTMQVCVPTPLPSLPTVPAPPSDPTPAAPTTSSPAEAPASGPACGCRAVGRGAPAPWWLALGLVAVARRWRRA